MRLAGVMACSAWTRLAAARGPLAGHHQQCFRSWRYSPKMLSHDVYHRARAAPINAISDVSSKNRPLRLTVAHAARCGSLVHTPVGTRRHVWGSVDHARGSRTAEGLGQRYFRGGRLFDRGGRTRCTSLGACEPDRPRQSWREPHGSLCGSAPRRRSGCEPGRRGCFSHVGIRGCRRPFRHGPNRWRVGRSGWNRHRQGKRSVHRRTSPRWSSRTSGRLGRDGCRCRIGEHPLSTRRGSTLTTPLWPR